MKYTFEALFLTHTGRLQQFMCPCFKVILPVNQTHGEKKIWLKVKLFNLFLPSMYIWVSLSIKTSEDIFYTKQEYGCSRKSTIYLIRPKWNFTFIVNCSKRTINAPNTINNKRKKAKTQKMFCITFSWTKSNKI